MDAAKKHPTTAIPTSATPKRMATRDLGDFCAAPTMPVLPSPPDFRLQYHRPQPRPSKGL